MYEVMIREGFSGAHRLRDYGGKCEELHGHNWKVEVFVRAEDLDERGLALDFRTLRDHTRDVLSRLDHRFLNDLEPFHKKNPSSENIARFIFEELSPKLQGSGARLFRVNVWESDTSCASYVGD